MEFSPRLAKPESTNKNYIHVSAGGKNKCLLRNGGSVLPNCVGYAWGRFMEILGSTPTLSCQNAEDWWAYRQDGYERGQTPRLGAVICWRKGQAGNGADGAGHVGIVEQINADGSIVTSESSYSSYYWRTKYRLNSSNNWGGGDYIFQGFIYNPAVPSGTVVGPQASGTGSSSLPLTNYITDFVNTAKSQIGRDGSWSWANSGQPSGNAWSCSFVAACAKEVKLLNVCIPKTFSCSAFAELGVAKKMGKWNKGPGQGASFTPSVGDIILLRYHSASEYSTPYSSDAVGIVSEVSSSSVTAILGHQGSSDPRSSKVKSCTYTVTSSFISGYYRPTWSLVGYSHWTYSSLYESTSTEKDAIVRELGYFNNRFEPSISPSNIKLSVINYTSPLSALFDNLHLEEIEGTGLNVIANIDHLESSQRITIDFLMSKGLNCAASVGIVANIEHESGFRTSAVGDYGTSFGICQWHLSRGDAMKRVAGANWSSNLTGQLNYLWQELSSSSFSGLLTQLQQVPNSVEGAKTAADKFVRLFEIPANVDAQSLLRQATAEKIWNSITQQLA